MKTNVVILGAGYAGILCANRLEKQNKNCKITLLSDQFYFQERIRFHEFAVGRAKKRIPIQEYLRKNIDFQLGKVTNIDPNNNTVAFHSHQGERSVPYDYLVVAIGSGNIKQLSPEENSIQSEKALVTFQIKKDPNQIKNLCILGGGLTGIELATEWKERFPNANVTIVDTKEFGHSFSETGKAHLKKTFARMGIKTIENIAIQSIQNGKISFQNKTNLEYDCLMNCTGFQTESLFDHSALHTNTKEQIYVDGYLRSKQHSNLFAIGDVAKVNDSILRMGCVTALPMGAYVADTINQIIKNKKPSEFQFQFFGRCVSLGRNDGLIQFTYGDDSPREWILKGKLAAWTKECVNRFTLFSIYMEKLLPFRFYLWPKGNLFQKHNWNQKIRETKEVAR
ncbi:NAD(P)/FAD-dependent oxidoreductase [Leptospira jelokensis]|uniref:NADH-quinone oxidoreductase subunit D n=1 Tax=Leptospira jelokensis TaxID=2484931 RepID=A0A4Z1A843_9LEPT|nr:FAD-dependent oxidoreductase [Leptospira jelokensis]TGL69911.1 NADH-quinone oxidoreductase subunit D [Leptospira jelokensis]